MRKLSSIIIAVLILLLFAACQQGPVTPPVVQEISLDRASTSVKVGDEFKLKATVVADAGADTTVTWATDRESVATVDSEGNVKALAVGAAAITATSGDKKTACLVFVRPEIIPVGSVSIDRIMSNIIVGNKIKLNAIIAPVDATYGEVKWSSKDETIAKVDDNGEVTGLVAGKSTIITATVGDKSGACVVVVLPQPIPVSSITLDKDSTAVAKGYTATIKATVNPDNATYYKVIWESSDESVLTVNDGVVAGIKSGSATVTAKAGDKTATCKVDVIEDVIAVTFDANDGTEKTWSQVIPKDYETELAGYMFSRDDFIFAGWNTTSGSTGDLFYDCETVKFTETKILYAQWVRKEVYSLSDDGTLGRGDGFVSFEFPECVCLPRSIAGKPVKTISDKLFGNDKSWNQIRQIKIPNGVTQIGEAVFNGCPNLGWLHLPMTLEGFNANSFTKSTNLHFKVEENNAKYTTDEEGKKLLSKDKTVLYSYPSCSKDLEIDGGIKEIGANAFYFMEIESVDFPDSLETIGDRAFYQTKIEELNIPQGVKKIGSLAFAESHHLEKVNINGGIELIGERAFFNSSMSKVVIEGDVDTIDAFAFNNDVEIETIEIKGSVKMIGEKAFGGIQFGDDGLVLKIRGKGAPAKTSDNMFEGAKIKEIQVLTELVDTYKNADGWKIQAQYIKPL